MPQRMLSVTVVLLVVIVFGLMFSTATPLIAQINPTEQEETVQAAIRDLLTATQAEVETQQTATTEARTTEQAQAISATETAQAEIFAETQTAIAVTPDLTQTISAGLEATVSALGVQSDQLAIGDAIAPISSLLLDVPGGTLQMGTTIQEAAEAVNECTQVYNANCQLAWAEDSIPRHPVQVSAFYIEQTEVRFQQLVAYLNERGAGSHLDCAGELCVATRNEDPSSPLTFDGDTYAVLDVIATNPATHVTWYGAEAYCAALGRRLPTEAEWELAARGTDGRLYPWGNTFTTDLARTRADGVVGALPVDAYPAGSSPYGALNMAGNVAEWVNDWYSASYYSVIQEDIVDPVGPLSGDDRVIRGGSWDAMPYLARSVHRQHLPPTTASGWVGFRCASDEPDERFEVALPLPQSLIATDAPSVVPSPSPTATFTATPEADEGTVMPIPTSDN